MSTKDLFKGLNEEQLMKARSCKSTAELLEAAKKEGIELSDEQLAAVSGGCGEEPDLGNCPNCNCDQIDKRITYDKKSRDLWECTCRNCGYTWFVS